MAAEEFEIVAEPARRLMVITMRGRWDGDTVSRYHQAIARSAAQMRAAGCPRGSVSVLVDARELSAQSQAAITEYRERFGNDDQFRPAKLATVVSSALFKLQVDRIAVPNQNVFHDRDAALAWITGSEARLSA